MKKEIKLKIKGSNWTMKFIDGFDVAQASEKVGLTNFNDHIIWIEIQKIDLMLKTIVHELVHVILYECGISDYADEDAVFALETMGVELINRCDDIRVYFINKYEKNLLKEYKKKSSGNKQ